MPAANCPKDDMPNRNFVRGKQRDDAEKAQGRPSALPDSTTSANRNRSCRAGYDRRESQGHPSALADAWTFDNRNRFARRRRRATGILRTIVVAAATVSILLVCFSIYQFNQLDAVVPGKAARPRLPATPTEPETEPFPPESSEIPSVTVGSTPIGPGRNVRLSIYAPEGQRARAEIAVASWTPVAGTLNEFLLIEPEIRLRTASGNAVRVTAKKGTLEANRHSGGSLDPLRGRLSGDVLIELDRLTEDQRRKLEEPRRSTPDPSELAFVRMEEISFDLEFSRVVVPGEIHVTAADGELRATDLEVRLNAGGTGVEYLRVSRGGRIEVREASKRLGGDLPGDRSSPSVPLTDWLRATLQAKTGVAPESSQAAQKEPEKTTKTPSLPVFRRGGKSEKAVQKASPTHYFARFEESVRAEQRLAGVISAELSADALEVLRKMTEIERETAQSSAQMSDKNKDNKPQEVVALQWTGQLLVESLPTGDPRLVEGVRARVTAIGEPAKLRSRDGEAVCGRLVVDPDAGVATMYAEGDRPVELRSPEEETLTGREVRVRSGENDFAIHVVGPGSLARRAPEDENSDSPDMISFGERLDIDGRIVKHTRISLTGAVSTEEQRLVQRAVFQGDVRMREGDTGASADEITVEFSPDRRGRRSQQAIEQVRARGHVFASQGKDRLSARELDLVLTTDRSGKARPLSMIARGEASASQGERTIHARDLLRVDFESIEVVSEPVAMGPPEPANVIDGGSLSGGPLRGSGSTRTDAVARRLMAEGEVRVTDPSESLDLSAEKLDAAVRNGRELETALIEGAAGRPATVQTQSLSVTGERIALNLPDEWAEVPGAGRMTFRSDKDLDGRKLEEPIPIVVTWTEWMKYQGRENRALFHGGVHAASRTNTTFDMERLLVEFDEKPKAPEEEKPVFDWSLVRRVADRFRGRPETPRSPLGGRAAMKQPAYLLATGKVVAATAETEATGELKSRATIRGPRMSLNLRKEVSKMLVEGSGNLLIEDFRPSAPGADPPGRNVDGLLSVDGGRGPSNTLIEWRDMMWYDFSIDQTRFEGNVQLRHFSGAELARVVRSAMGGSTDPGRKTFLSCDVLTVDFGDPSEPKRTEETRRMGRLSAGRLRQFQALGAVHLEDEVERLMLSAESASYERDRNLLSVYGSQSRKARIVIQPPGEYPQDITAERFFYNLSTRTVEAAVPGVKRR